MDTGVNSILRQLGGTPDKNKTGVDQIVEILENGGGVGGLPEVDSTDNGKVLTVIDGAWAAGSGGGGGGGSIPTTREDIGKYLGVKESETETEVGTVIPQQTSTVVQGFAALNDCDVQFFKNATVGETISAVIDGVEMTLTAAEMYGTILFVNGDHAVGFNGLDAVSYGYMGADQPASVTISATGELPSPEVDWLAVPGPLVVTVEGGVSDATYNKVKEAIDRGASVRFIYSNLSGYLYCGIALSYEYDSEDSTNPYKVYVIRTDYDAEQGTMITILETFESADADTDVLSLL